MARRFEIQQRQWISLIFESYLTYETLDTFEIVKHSGGVLRSLEPKGQIDEIVAVLTLFVESKLLRPKDKESVTYFGIAFDSYTYEITEEFKKIVEESISSANQPKYDDFIQQIKVENTTNNTTNVYYFNFSFAIEKIFEIKAALVNLL